MVSVEVQRIVSPVGMTGGGKSTITDKLGPYLGIPGYSELAPTDNEFFEAYIFYLMTGVTPNPAAYDEQIAFLNSSLDYSNQIIDASHRQAIFEMPPVGHFMYAFLLHKGKHITREEFIEYCRYYIEHVSMAVSPSVLVVVLNRKPQLLQQRLQQRAEDEQEEVREMETKVDVSYWKSQLAYWEERLAAEHDYNPDLQQNYPLAELEQILPSELFAQFAQLAFIPMIPFYSDLEENTLSSQEDVERVFREKFATVFGHQQYLT